MPTTLQRHHWAKACALRRTQLLAPRRCQGRWGSVFYFDTFRCDIQIGQRGWFDLGNSGPGNSSRLQSVYLKIGTWMTQKGSRLFRAICGKEESNLITSERENFTKKSQRAFGSLKKSSFGKVPTFTLDSCLWCFLYIIYIFCFFFFCISQVKLKSISTALFIFILFCSS